MARRMTVSGVGPIIAAISGPYLLLALIMTYACGDVFVVKGIPYPWFAAFGSVLLGMGLPLFLRSARAVRRAFRKGKLVTEGCYSVCRHPVYASALVCITGVAMFFRSWLLFSVPLVAYAAIRFLIKKEDDYLEEEFGEEFLEYKRKVNALFPTLRR